jgi:drug/metabolite transporter (DMT)-like permease
MSDDRKGLLLSLLGCLASAFYLTSYKVAAGLGDTKDAVFVMMVSAAVLNSLTSTLQSRGQAPFPSDRKSILISVVLAGLTLAGNQYAVDAVARISAPLTSVVQQTQVLFVALMGRVFLGDTVGPRFWVGAAVAVLGASVLHVGPTNQGSVDAAGMAMAVGSAACFSAMNVLTRKYIHQIRPVAVNALRLWMSVALWLALERRVPSSAGTTSFLVAAALAGVFGPFLSRTAIMYSLKYLPPTRTTLIGLITPAITLVPAFLAFGTVPSGRELLGGTLMIAGIAIPLVGPRAPKIGPKDIPEAAAKEDEPPPSSEVLGGV